MKGRVLLKTFFGCTFLDKNELAEEGIRYPIKIEYYKEINENYRNYENEAKYGIYLVKTQYKPNNTIIEEKSIKYVTNDELEENKILKIFKENKVTIINSEEVISDIFRNKF